MLTILAYRSCGIAIYTEAEFSDEAHSAQHAQSVFVEAFSRVADGANYLVLYVLLAVVGVNYMSFIIVQCDGVDGEVASRQVFEQGSAECDGVRTTLVRISRLGAVGSNFDDGEASVF